MASGADAPYPAGLSDQMIDVGGVGRQFRVHVPAGLSTPRAVVFVLHGGGGEGLDVANLGSHPLSVFRTVADREGFAVVYPGGLPAHDATARAGWVDCRADNTVSSGADDVGFLAALVTRVRGEYGLTNADMFMAGGSNGAQMTHAFAFHHADLVGAVATASGSLPETPLPGPCTTGPGRPLPILILHGTADTQMPWGGGCVANLGGACNRGRVISAEATRDRWLEINGLMEVTPVKSVIEVSSTDAGPAVRWDYAGAAPLQWWQLEGAGHTTPSQTVLSTPNPVTGTQNRDIEFAEVAWSFFAARLAAGGRTISVPDGQTLTQSQAGHPLISGASEVRKIGGGTLLLDAANSYTGPTSISAGGLTLTNPSALGSSPAIEVAATASLDVRPLAGGLSLGSGQTLGGDGSVLGSVMFGQGSTLSPGMFSGAPHMGLTTTLGKPVPVPEPSTLGLFGIGLGLLTVGRRRGNRGARAAVLACALALVAAFGSSGQAQSRFDFSPVTDPITQYLASRPAIPGAGLLIADFEGDVIHEQYWGTYDRHTVVPIASASKWLSAGVIMSLVDQGTLDLDRPVGQTLTSFAGRPNGKADMTVRQMFSHTSGLPGQTQWESSSTVTLQEAAAGIGQFALMRAPPGASFAYGGASMHVAGAVAEAEVVGGMGWADLFTTRIAGPLGMTATDYLGVGTAANPRIAGGIRSSVGDIAAYLRMIGNQGLFAGQRILSPEAVQVMLSDQTGGAVATSVPGGIDAYRGYGMGAWIERTDRAGQPVEFSSPGVFGTTPWINVEHGYYGVFLVDSSLAGFDDFTDDVRDFTAARFTAEQTALFVSSGSLTQGQLGHETLSGERPVVKTGGGTVILDAANSYTGPTSISAGGLTLTNPSALGSSPAIEVAAAALLDVRPLVGGFSIESGQTLAGDGTVAGSITFGQGSTLSPGMLTGESSAAFAASDGARNVFDLVGVTAAVGIDQRAELPANPTAVAVPEPSTYAMVLVSLACGGFRNWCPRRSRPGARHAAAGGSMRGSATEEAFS